MNSKQSMIKVNLLLGIMLFPSPYFSILSTDTFAQGTKLFTVPANPSLIQTEYNAESQIGLVPENLSSEVALANTQKLNAALDAMWSGGKFTFVDGTTGPILKPIRIPAKEYFFKGTIQTSKRIGGKISGSGGRAYAMTGEHYSKSGTIGGATTRLTRIDGGTTAGGKTAILRMRGSGFVVENLVLQGRPYLSDSKGEGPLAGSKTPVGIEIEGRAVPATGQHTFRELTIQDCDYGICCKAGFYADGNGDFIKNENHADSCVVDTVCFWSCASAFRSENQQAVVWTFRDCLISSFGGAGQVHDQVMCDVVRGGNYNWFTTSLLTPEITLFKVHDWSPNTAQLSCYDCKWDGLPSNPTHYFRVFEYDGPVYPGTDMRWIKWWVRCTGHIANENQSWYDTEKIVKFPDTAAKNGIDRTNLLFDIFHLPTAHFEPVGEGPWYRPLDE